MSRLRSRSYPRALADFDLTVGLGRALFEGIWLGLLDFEDTAAIDEWYYDHASQYRDDDHNRRGLFAWERAMLERYFTPEGRLLVSAIGGGREIVGLLDAGYDAYGFECNQTLLAAAQRLLADNEQSRRVEWSPRGDWPAVSTPFDGVVLGWGSYTLGPTPAHRAEMLRNAAAHVTPGGPVLFSFLATSTHGRADQVTARLANGVRRLRRHPPTQLGDRLAPNFVHVFTREQIEAEVAASGLRLLHYSSQGYGHAVAVTPRDR